MKGSRLPVVLAAGTLFVVVLLLGSLVLIRALPGRYAYYLPEPFRSLRHGSHPDVLPTPEVTFTVVHLPASTATSVPTPTPSFTPSPLPTRVSAATSIPTITPLLSPTHSPTVPPRVILTGIRHEAQGWNNCGPTTLAMGLSYLGRGETQYDLVPLLKPDPEDKHVGMGEMESYVRSVGLGSIVRVNGSVEKLKSLLRAGFPVIVSTWHVRSPSDQLGHYRLVAGYDDASQEFILYDSLEGPDLPIGYRELNELWRVYNRRYMVIYEADQWENLAAVLAADLDDAGMLQRALEVAQAEAAAPPVDCVAYASCADWVTFSWFNVGSSLNSLGRYSEAAAAFDQARQLGLPFRMLWYQFGPYESYYGIGRYDDVIALANATLATANNLEESYYWRGMGRLALGDEHGARADFESALHYHEAWPPAAAALEGLSQQ